MLRELLASTTTSTNFKSKLKQFEIFKYVLIQKVNVSNVYKFSTSIPVPPYTLHYSS